MNSFVWNGFNKIFLFKDERNEEKIAYRQLPNFFFCVFFRFWIHFRPFYADVFFFCNCGSNPDNRNFIYFL